MNLLRRNLLLGAAGIAAGGLGIWASLRGFETADHADLTPLWAAQFRDLDGKPLAMASLRGQPLIINFWASWCAPCLEEMPDFQRFSQGPGGKKAKIVGIGIDTADKMLPFAKKLGISYQLVEAGAKGLDILTAAGDKPRVLPFTLVVDSSGNAVFRKIGKLDHDQLSEIAAKL
ncbi:MAG TPA: TlpA disulfide reductase family protein [Burkholderiales bacterium]|jgi:thiol-disulfide isomerase/thioredoxin